jgi:hypothetical protein
MISTTHQTRPPIITHEASACCLILNRCCVSINYSQNESIVKRFLISVSGFEGITPGQKMTKEFEERRKRREEWGQDALAAEAAVETPSHRYRAGLHAAGPEAVVLLLAR